MSGLERLTAWVRAHPLAAPIIAGAFARAVAATVGFGFHARDDYLHVLEPALRWIADPGFDWDDSGIAGGGIRSHLVPRVVQMIIEALNAAGVESPQTVLQGVYLVMGAYSLTLIPAVHLAAKRLLDSPSAHVATWLAAVHFVLPYAGTRLLIEAMAMPPLIFGLYFVSFPGPRRIAIGGVLIGLACWFRLQVAAAALGVVIAVALIAWRAAGAREAARRVSALAAGGAIGLGIQGAFDVATTGIFLGPLFGNLAQNLDAGGELTRSRVLTYLWMWLALTVPPATLVVVPGMVRAARRLPLVTWPFVTFVLLHTVVPHKEERFMIPALPLFLLLLAAAPGAIAEAPGRWWDRARRWWPAARILLIITHTLALLIATTSRSQANQREAMTTLRDDRNLVGIVSFGPEIHPYFLDHPHVPMMHRGRPDAVWFAEVKEMLKGREARVNRYLCFAADRDRTELILATEGLLCDEPVRIDGWWLDRWVYAANPRHNRRRSPILIYRCERPAFAWHNQPARDKPAGP